MLKFISSVRLAIILIAALAGMGVSATIYNLPALFQSIPFRVLVAAFFINLLTCSLKILPQAIRTLLRKPEALVGEEARYQAVEMKPEDLETFLKKERFHVARHQTPSGTYLLAKKNRPGFMSHHILHLGLLVILIGAFLTTFQTEGQLMLAPGETQPLPPAIEKSVGKGVISVDDFVTEYGKEGNILNWVTTFDLKLDDTVIAKNVTTRVNHPYKGHGLSIYQMAYQNEYIVHIEGSDEETGDYAIPESQRFPLSQKAVDIEPMTEGIALLYTYDSNGKQTGSYAFKKGSKIQVDENTTIEYLQTRHATVLQIKYNRALPVVFAGFILAGLGSVLFLTGRYCEVRAFLNDEGVRLRLFNKNPYQRKRYRRRLMLEVVEEKEGS